MIQPKRLKQSILDGIQQDFTILDYFDFLDNEDFLNALEKQKVKLFVKPGMPLVSWDEILQFVSDHKSERVGYKILPNDFAFFYNRTSKNRWNGWNGWNGLHKYLAYQTLTEKKLFQETVPSPKCRWNGLKILRSLPHKSLVSN